MLPERSSPHQQRHIFVESERMKLILQANRSQKPAGVVMLISNKTDFKPKSVKKDRRSLHMNKGNISSRIYNRVGCMSAISSLGGRGRRLATFKTSLSNLGPTT